MISVKTILLAGFMGSFLLLEENDSLQDPRMEWWEDARFGMFLHWGVYSVFGGEYNGVDYGKEMGGASAEWIYLTGDIPREEYMNAAGRFNPVHYNPSEWVRMAKEAGMKYMVLTSKHHDGFAMFDTKASNWNIMKASPYGKDIVRSYIQECHKQGMGVGLYFSHEKDWIHGKKIRRNPNPLTEEYIKITLIHLKELLTNYGTIDVIWFDMGISNHKEFNLMCYEMVRKYQPDCIISSRIGSGLGDYRNLGDRQLASPGVEDYVESIMTLRLNWGFDNNDNNWKSSDEVISMLSKCACRGSNFLLNIGPQPDGRFSPEEIIRLENIGRWMQVNSDAIYETSGSPFMGEYTWGSLTTKGNKVFLHLFHWQEGDIHVNGIASAVNKAYLLAGGQELDFKQESYKSGMRISVPESAGEDGLPVIVLEIEGILQVDETYGPKWIPPSIKHLTRKAITGMATNVDGTEFKIRSGDKDYSFSLNENLQYRIKNLGVIREVQGFYLETGKTYKVIFTPYEEPVVEIITELN